MFGRKFTIAAAMLAAVGLAGCMPTGPSPEEMAAFKKEADVCAAKPTRVAWAECANAVLAEHGQTSDLDQVLAAKRIELAEKVDAKKMTVAEANLQFATMNANLTSEAHRRSAEAAAAMPVSCTSTPLGSAVTTTCY